MHLLMDTGLELRAAQDRRLWVGNEWEVGDKGARGSSENTQEANELGYGHRPSMAHPQSPFPLSLHNTRSITCCIQQWHCLLIIGHRRASVWFLVSPALMAKGCVTSREMALGSCPSQSNHVSSCSGLSVQRLGENLPSSIFPVMCDDWDDRDAIWLATAAVCLPEMESQSGHN